MAKRKQLFLTINGIRLHIVRFKNVWKVTCFDEENTFLGLNQDRYSQICRYLIAEGFVEEGAEIIVKFVGEEEDRC